MTITFKHRPELGELQGENAISYVDKSVRLCPNCLCAQTNIQFKKKLTKEFNKGYVQVVLKCINENDMKLFTKKELMEKLHAINISNGGLQDVALSVLIVLDYLRKEEQEWIDEDKELRLRFIYIKTQNQTPSLCYDEKRDMHIQMDWANDGIAKHFYQKRKKVREEQ